MELIAHNAWARSRSMMLGVALVLVSVSAHGRAQQAPAAPPIRVTPRSMAQADLTGYWVAEVTEDWRFRMITPPKGDYSAVPLNNEGRRVADSWDPATDRATGQECRAYGAGGLMRLPTRIHITWADDSTLKLETDAGRQTRFFVFDSDQRPPAERTWQGYSVATWTREIPTPVPGARAASAAPGADVLPRPLAPPGGLKVITTNLRPGYLRKNGVPYSENAVVTEYYDRATIFGTDYLQVVTVVTDPTYLTMPFVVSNHFKHESDGTKWNPTECATDPPLGKLPRANRN